VAKEHGSRRGVRIPHHYSADKNRRSFWVGAFNWLAPGADWDHQLPHLSTQGLDVPGRGADWGRQSIHLSTQGLQVPKHCWGPRGA